MSVVLLMSSKADSSVVICLPIADQTGYREFCVPVAARLGLIWLPLFEGGFPVGPENVQDVAREFEQLRDELISDGSTSKQFTDRLGGIVEALRNHANRNDLEVWIG